MAFTLQIPSSDRVNHSTFIKPWITHHRQPFIQKKYTMTARNQYDRIEKLGQMGTSLCFQTDVFFPNALAAVTGVSCEDNRYVLGCKGHQIQRDFVLEPRVPFALPLVQYPISGMSLEDLDTCAQPVMNWERCVRELRLRVFRVNHMRGVAEYEKIVRKRANAISRKYTKRPDDKAGSGCDAEKRKELESRFEDDPLQQGMEIDENSVQNTNADVEISSERKEEQEEEALLVEVEKPQPSTSTSAAAATTRKIGKKAVCKKKKVCRAKKVCREKKVHKARKRGRLFGDNPERHLKEKKRRVQSFDVAQKLFPGDIDYTLSEKDQQKMQEKKDREVRLDGISVENMKTKLSNSKTTKKKKEKKKPEILDMDLSTIVDDFIRPVTSQGRLINPALLALYKTQPEVKVQATWNYFYGGLNGACCGISDRKGNYRDVYTSRASQLRKVKLKKSNPASILSYAVESIWEEAKSEVPTNKRTNCSTPDHLCDVIFQIVPLQKTNIVGVRRGKSVELYCSEEDENPYLLESIPNICYGTAEYAGWKKRSGFDDVNNPLLVGLDFNPQYSPEFITIDENKQIRICDFTKGSTLSTYVLEDTARPSCSYPDYPKFSKINDASGVNFTSFGQTFYAWTDSNIYLGDRRDHKHARSSLMNILDLRRAISSQCWSDQFVYHELNIELNEYVSSLKSSGRDYYYYVGTTARILLMDSRVPGQPVLKADHGMRSAAAYLETCITDNFETVVAACQRHPKTFCMVTDHAHVNCVGRPSCESNNPILQCLPRHLSSSKDFFDAAIPEGFFLSWETEHRRAERHNYAWTTGLLVDFVGKNKTATEAPGISILTSNSFGDLFYQEWWQPPIETHKKTTIGDVKLTEFLHKWRNSMRDKSMTEFQKPSLNTYMPMDLSLLLEPSAKNILKMYSVRHKKFDPFALNMVQNQLAVETMPTFEDNMVEMRKYKGEIAQEMLDVWSSEDGTSRERDMKQEQEDLMDYQYGDRFNEDGTLDIEVVDEWT